MNIFTIVSFEYLNQTELGFNSKWLACNWYRKYI